MVEASEGIKKGRVLGFGSVSDPERFLMPFFSSSKYIFRQLRVTPAGSLPVTQVAGIEFMRSKTTLVVGLELRSDDSCLPERQNADQCHSAFSGDNCRSLPATQAANIEFMHSKTTLTVGLEPRSDNSCLPEHQNMDRCLSAFSGDTNSGESRRYWCRR
ncbi:unnamed protein product [Lactuca saligna]|uniref:Uncharacterized protein n=1 Tax=Lactuca saligna TaxID=75948 RepID=A0AA35Y916_LACSI|nr:unnamed protein product [Lactuca saligna]